MNTSKHYNLTAFHHNLARLSAGRYPSARDDSKYLTPTPYRSMPARTPRAAHPSGRHAPEPRLPQALVGDTFPTGFRRSYVFLQNWPRKRRKTELRRKRGAPSLGLLRATAPRAPRSLARRNAHSPRDLAHRGSIAARRAQTAASGPPARNRSPPGEAYVGRRAHPRCLEAKPVQQHIRCLALGLL